MKSFRLQFLSFPKLPCLLIFSLLQPQPQVEGSPASSGPSNFASSTGIFGEPQWRAPTFIEEPADRIEFLNEHGCVIVCIVDGYPLPEIHFLGGDNKIVSNIDNFRTVFPNATLLIHPFKPASYRQDVHSTTYRCVASNSVGAIRSRDIHVRAVISQQWSVKVVSNPVHLSLRAGPILLKCEVDLMGGREFITVTGWKRDGKFITVRPQRLYESGDEDEPIHFHILPNGDLVIESLLEEDAAVKVTCVTRHKITQQEIASPSFIITFSEEPSHARSRDDLNIAESFPAPIVVRKGDPIVLHCSYGLSSSSKSDANIRWEKLSGNSWIEVPMGGFSPTQLRQIGRSLVSERSTKMASEGNYRCRGDSSKESLGEFEVRVREPLSVSVVINQAQSPLEATAELTCTITSSSHESPSVIWLKDATLINPGGRIRFFATNVLQINQIQQDDRGMYQCFARARTEMESAQAAVRLELSDAQPRLIYGFNDQTLMPGPAVSIRCVFSGWPTPTVTWWLDGWPLVSYDDDSRILTGNITSHGHLISYLNISETRVEDGGNYACKAVNRASGLRPISHSSRLNIYGPLWIRVVSPVVAISGELFILSCPITGWPIPSFSSITWEKDGLPLPLNPRQRVGTNGSLTITMVDKSDSGSYHCSIPDAQGRALRREIRVNVVAPLKIAPFPEKGKVVEGERLTLVCAVPYGDDTIKIQWSMVASQSHLPSTRHRFASTLLQQRPELSEQDERKLKQGSVFPDGFSVLNTDPFTSLLSIPKVAEHHAALYVCNASSAAGTASRSHDLTVLVPPKIAPFQFAFQEALQEGSRTRVICGITDGDEPVEFTWIKTSSQHPPTILSMNTDEPWTKNIEISNLDSFSTLLRFSPLSPLHSGEYTCVVRNVAAQTQFSDKLQDSFSAKLIVQVAPKWVKEPEDINITRGESGRLDCSGYGIPEPKGVWFKSTVQSTEDGKESNWRSVQTIWPSAAAQAISLENGSLIFHTVEETHQGKYMCSVSNGIGSGLSKIVQLHVHVQPYFMGSESQTLSLIQGKTHEIRCDAISSSPIYLTWSKASHVFVNVPANRIHTVIVMEGRRTKSTLIIKDIRSDDTGLYKCTASNSLGKVTRSYRLVVEEQPPAPEHLRLSEESQRNGPEATRVFLEWDLPPSEYSSKKLLVPGEDPSRPFQRTTTTTTADFPPILMYVLEFSLTSANTRFSRRVEVPGEKCQAKVENLRPGSQYIFRVYAVNSAGPGLPSETLLVYTANIPPTVSPSNGRGTAESSRAILVSWSPIPMTFGKILAYHIVLSSNTDLSLGNVENTATILVPSAASYTNFHNNATVNEQNCCQKLIHGLSPYTQYEIRLSAINIAGEGPLSPPFFAQTSEEAPQLPPRNPQCLSLTSRSIQISWQHPLPHSNGPINSYKIVFYPLEFNTQNYRLGGETHRTTGLTSTAVIGGLQPNTNYSFCITPINSVAEGSGSLNVFCKTSEDVPSSPTNLIGFPSTGTSVYLSFLHPRKSNGILTHHTIYSRMIDKVSDSFEVKRTIPANVDYYEENELDLSRLKYVFWVTSSNRMGESKPSPQLIFNPPPVEMFTTLVGQPRNIEIQQGNPMILPCRILEVPMVPISEHSVNWSLDGKRVVFDGNVYMKAGQNDLIFIRVRKSDQGNYTCQMKNKNGNRKTLSTKKLISGMELQPQHLQLTYSLTYGVQVKAPACIPKPFYRIVDRDILVAWTVDERSSSCDAPLGFILYFRVLGSILDWKKIMFQPTARNYTFREATCGSILNMYIASFNEVGNSPDSHLFSLVVSHLLAPFPQPYQLIVPNVTSVLLNLQPLNANTTFCPVEKFSVALKEWRSTEWFAGKDVKIQFKNEFAIDGLKPSTPYELTITAYGYSTSRSTTLTFTTLTVFGDDPSPDVLSKHKVISEHSSFYNNLTLILPSILSIIAIFAATIAIVVYCKTRRQAPIRETINSVAKQPNDANYGYLQQRKNTEEQFYSGLPCPPCTPGIAGLVDISPYATFQIDPKKFHEETFSQEIVVAKFHHLPRGSTDKWMGRDSRQMQDSEDSESENAQRYSVIPAQRSHPGNLYQINPPSQPPPPLLYQSMGYHHHQFTRTDNSDLENGGSSSSEGDPSRTTMDRRMTRKDRGDRKSLSKKSGKLHQMKESESGSSSNLRRHKRKSTTSDYSIAV